MAKQIKLSYQGKDYVLEYSRKSVSQMETLGFDINNFQNKLMTSLPLMFSGTFIMHHRFIKQELIDEIFATLKDKTALSTALIEMISEAYNSLFDEPEESEKNASWEIV